MNTLIDAFMVAAGISLVVHVGACALSQRGLRVRPDVMSELYAIPNRPIAPDSSLRLLRVRYYFPWVRVPDSVNSLDFANRILIIAARLSGLTFLIGILGFLLLSVVQAGQ